MLLILSFWQMENANAKNIYRYRDKKGVIHFTDAPTDKRYKIYKLYGSRGTGGARVYRTDMAAFLPYINAAAVQYRLDPNLIKAVIKAESAFDPKAVSLAGARGLMQLMPDTAREMKVRDSFDPRQNIFGGSKYLRYLLNRYKGDLKLALAAYNLGPSSIRIGRKIPAVKETRQYVKRVTEYYALFKR